MFYGLCGPVVHILSYLFITDIIFTSISQSLNISIQMCLLYGNISKFSYPGVILPAAGLTFKMYSKKMSATIKLLQDSDYYSRSVVYFYTCSSSLMKVDGVAELCCTIFKVKTCLQFNCGHFHCLKEKVNIHGFHWNIHLFWIFTERHWRTNVYTDLLCYSLVNVKLWFLTDVCFVLCSEKTRLHVAFTFFGSHLMFFVAPVLSQSW